MKKLTKYKNLILYALDFLHKIVGEYTYFYILFCPQKFSLTLKSKYIYILLTLKIYIAQRKNS